MSPISFEPSRSRDENEIIKELTRAYNACLLVSNQTLDPVDINATFSCVEALFQNVGYRLSNSGRIKGLIDEYKSEYFEAVGIKKAVGGVDRSSMAFLVNLNEKVKTIFNLIREGLG